MDVNVRDFGAIGDDTHDDTLAFRNALNAIRSTGGNCFVPQGTYKIAGSGIMGGNHGISAITEGMNLVGLGTATDGGPAAYLHINEDPTAVIVLCDGNNWSIQNLGFNMSDFYGGSGKNPITVRANGYYSGWLIDKCWLLNCGDSAIVARGTRFTISNCKITNNTVITFIEPPPDPNYIPHGWYDNAKTPEGIRTTVVGNNPPSGFPSYGKFINNVIQGCSAFDTLGNHHFFLNNTTTQMSFAAGYFEGGEVLGGVPNNNSSNNTYIRNTAKFAQEGPDNYTHQEWTQARGFEIWTPYTLLFHNNSHDNCGAGFTIGGKRSIAVFNRAIDNGRDIGNPMHHHESGFNPTGLTGAGRTFVNNSGGVYLGNVAHDTRPAMTKTQDYGLHVRQDSVRGLSIIGNNFHGNNIGEGLYGFCQPNVGTFKGRDMFQNLMDEQQRNMIQSLLDSSLYTITDAEYLILNQLLTGSSQARP